MFTGLVEQVGHLTARKPKAGGARVRVACTLGALALGESVAVDGACLTVASSDGASFEADASSETLERSTLGKIRIGSAVNLERAMLAGGRFGGHLVSGHIDAVGIVSSLRALGNATEWSFHMPADLARFVAPKGSITISGISLTVNSASATEFTVAIIPHTLAATALAHAGAGTEVNLEVDLVARYLARLMQFGPTGEATTSLSVSERDHALLGALTKSGYR